MTRKTVVQTPRETCYFCGSEGPIETHHVVPRRYDGSESEDNLVDLCPTCHQRLERLYDKDALNQINEYDQEDGLDRHIPEFTQQQLDIIIGRITELIDRSSNDQGVSASKIEASLMDLGLSEPDAHHALEQTASRATLTVIDNETSEPIFTEGFSGVDKFEPFPRAESSFSNEFLKTHFDYCPHCDELYLPIRYGAGEGTDTCSRCGGVDPEKSDDFDEESISLDRGERIRKIIQNFSDDYEDGAPIELVVARAEERLGLEKSKVEHEIEKLKQKGEAYQPSSDYLRST